MHAVARPGGVTRVPVAVTVIGLVVAALMAWAAPAVGRGGTTYRHITTGKFSVTCTSTGELCTPPEALTFKLRHRGTLTSIVYTTPATHCSAVKLHVLRNGHQIAQTGKLATGDVTERTSTDIRLHRGSTTLDFEAQGFVGGCNVGTVFSWGGKVTITVRFGT